VVVLANGREARVTARVEAKPGPLAALLEVVIAPSRLVVDDALPERELPADRGARGGGGRAEPAREQGRPAEADLPSVRPS
jgi:hypothetical protein